MLVLIASQGQEEGKESGSDSTHNGLVLIHEAIAERGCDVGERGQAPESEVLRRSEGSICEHGGGQTEAASLHLVGVGARINCHGE